MKLTQTLLVTVATAASVLAGGAAQAQPRCLPNNEPIKFAGITWDSGQFYTEIIRTLIERGYGCKTDVVSGSTAATEAALVSGDLQVWVEQWGRTDIIKKGVEMGRIKLVGDLLEGGSYEGFFVPEFMIRGDAKKGIKASAPDLKSVADLPKYKQLFQDDEEPGKGRLLSCPVGWDCERINTQKLKAYKLGNDFINFRAGTGAAMDATIISAMERGSPILFYYWSPASLMAKYKFVRLQEPTFNEACWETVRKAEVKDPCPSATPNTKLTVGVTTALATASPDIVAMIEKVQLNGEQINAAILKMTERKIKPDVAAREFMAANPPVWDKWIDSASAIKVKASLK
jgi:glycine betaine/proline transport system substrate-binding protein